MKKLIQTNFVYTYRYDWEGSPGRTSRASGSYLGRKEASVATIHRFLKGNAKRSGVPFVLIDVAKTGSHQSSWIHK